MNAWITHLWHNSVTHLRVPVRHFLFFSLVCTLLALFFPSKRSQPILRRGLITDIIYYFLVPIWYEPLDAVLKLGLVAFAYSHATTTHLLKYGLAPLGDMPYWSQLLLGMLMADVMIYWLHRSSHIFPLLWRFHVIHHSSSDVDWLSSGRFHIVNLIFQNTIPMAVLLLVGFSPQALAWVAFLLWFGSILEHCNLNWSFGPLRYVVVSPVTAGTTRTRTRAGIRISQLSSPSWTSYLGRFICRAANIRWYLVRSAKKCRMVFWARLSIRS